MSRIIDKIEIYEESNGLIVKGKALDSSIPTTANRFVAGADILGVDGKLYRNGGTTASPSWQDTNEIITSEIANEAITTAKIDDGAVTYDKLEEQLKPVAVLKYIVLGSEVTTTAYEGVIPSDVVVTHLADGTSTVAFVTVADTLPADPADTSYLFIYRLYTTE